MKTRRLLHHCIRSLAMLAIAAGVCVGIASPTNAGTLYWGAGTVNKSNGTPLPTVGYSLGGTWDTLISNWSVDSLGTTYTTWSNTGTDNTAWIGYGANFSNNFNGETYTITLGDNLSINRLRANVNTGLNKLISVTAAAVRTVALNGVLPGVDVGPVNNQFDLQTNVRLTGTAGLIKRGAGKLRLYGDCSGLSGTVTNLGGTITVNTGANLSQISNFALSGTLAVSAVNGANDKLGNSALVTLRGGTFQYDSTATSAETISQIVLDSSGTLDLANGTAGGTLTLAHPTTGIDRGPYGRYQLRVTNVNGSDTFRAKVIVQNHSFPTDTTLGWMHTTRHGFCKISSADNSIVPAAMTTAPTDLSTWVAGSDYRCGNNDTWVPTGSINNDLTINSLGFNPALACTITIAPGKTLTIESGGMANDYRTVSGGDSNPRIISGGMLTAGSSGALYFHGGFSGSAEQRYIRSEIVGNIDFVKTGTLTLNFDGMGTNKYTGVTYLCGSLNVAKPGGRTAIPGDLVIARSGRLNIGASSNLVTTANVTISTGGSIDHGSGYNQIYGGVFTMAGGSFITGNTGEATFNRAGTGLAFNGGRFIHNSSGNATYSILTDVSYAASSVSQALILMNYASTVDSQNVRLCRTAGTFSRTFNIADSTVLAADVPEMVIAVPVTQTTGTAGLTKTGTGTLALRRASYTLSGTVDINGGILLSDGAWQAATRQGRIENGSTVVTGLSSTSDLAIGQPVTGTGLTASSLIASIDSPTQITLTLAATADASPTLTFTGRGGMGKAQVITGTTANGSATITMTSTNGLAVRQPLTGANNVGGTISSIGPGANQITMSQNANAAGAVAITFTGGSAVGRGAVNVNSAGTLMGGGVAGPITVNNGGTIDAGNTGGTVGTLLAGDNVSFAGATSTWKVDISSGTTSDRLVCFGNISLGGTCSPNFIEGYTPPASGLWTIATYTGTASGSMTAPPTYSVKIDAGGKRIQLEKVVTGTMVILR